MTSCESSRPANRPFNGRCGGGSSQTSSRPPSARTIDRSSNRSSTRPNVLPQGPPAIPAPDDDPPRPRTARRAQQRGELLRRRTRPRPSPLAVRRTGCWSPKANGCADTVEAPSLVCRSEPPAKPSTQSVHKLGPSALATNSVRPARPATTTSSRHFEQLSPQEMQIAQLLRVGPGLTNREIGQRLYLSPRTVSSHLCHELPQARRHLPSPSSRTRSRARATARSLPEPATNRHMTGACRPASVAR